MRASLRSEVEAFLLRHGAHTAKQIAAAIRARRADVDVILAEPVFSVAPTPDGALPRATYFDVSHRVPRSQRARADVMLDVLRDNRAHSRSELWEAGGGFFLTNNAAAELRHRGFGVVYDRKQDSYRITSWPTDELAAA